MIENLDVLKELIKVNVAPIMVNFDIKNMFNDAVLLDSMCSNDDLNGKYDDGGNFIAPQWYNTLIDEDRTILIINNINDISSVEQDKFYELLKYRKISTFLLPSKVVIIVTINENNDNKINENISSLCSMVW